VATGDRDQRETLAGLAKRWLKTQLRFHGDPIKGRHDRDEAEAIETEMRDRVGEDVGNAVFNTVLPEGWKRKLGDLERYAEDQRLEAARRERAEHEARPRADVDLTFSGDLTGRVRASLPALVSHPESDGEPLTVDLSLLEPIPVGARSFRGLQFAIPAYAGPGSYDLTALYRRLDADWDPFWFQLWLESDDEPFYWIPDYGPASVALDSDARTVRLRIPWQDAGSTRLVSDATIILPELDRSVSP
jgi:hypothetical protein